MLCEESFENFFESISLPLDMDALIYTLFSSDSSIYIYLYILLRAAKNSLNSFLSCRF